MKQVLLAVDTDEERAREQAETVIDLFDTENVEAHLFHVFGDNPEGASVGQIAAVRRVSEQLEEAGIETTLHEESGEPAETIVRRADELDVNAICVSGRKRSPTGKVLFGSVTQSVILNTERPVLVAASTLTTGD